MVSQAAVLLPNIQARTIKPLANLSPARSPAVPGIATADESGLPGLYASGWFGFFAPKGTPKDIIGKLNAAMVRVLAEPSLRPRFTQLGLDVASPELQTPEGLGAFHKAEIEKWWPILKSANIRTE
jgi:tripartite-type tricarboxylate transporter receptor subunit TctC